MSSTITLYHLLLCRPFSVEAGSVAYTAVPICCESGSVHKLCVVEVVLFVVTVFEEGSVGCFRQVADLHHT